MLSGDNHAVLTELLERVIPILVRPRLAPVQHELADAITNILSILESSDQGLFSRLVRGFGMLLEGERQSDCRRSTHITPAYVHSP